MLDQHRPDDRSSTPLALAAAASLALAGASLAAYALVAFTSPDWTIAGPGLLVAAAGVGGVRWRWLHLAGLVPLTAMLSVAGPVLAFDLARPGETSYFVGTILIIVGGVFSAVLGTANAVVSRRRAFPIATSIAIAATPLMLWTIVVASPSSAATSDGISEADRDRAVDVEMIDFAFVFDASAIDGGQVLRVRNTGTLPHDFTVPALDVAVFVPSGRETYVRLPATEPGTYELICTVGDHVELGMRTDISIGAS